MRASQGREGERKVNERVPLAQALKPGCACVSVSVLKDKTASTQYSCALNVCKRRLAMGHEARKVYGQDALKREQRGDRAGQSEAFSGPARRLIEYGCDKGVQGSPSQL